MRLAVDHSQGYSLPNSPKPPENMLTTTLGNMNLVATIYTYAADSEKIAQIRPRHRDFIAELNSAGKILGSGPFTDGEGGALIVLKLPEGSSLDDARAIMDRDPFYVEGAVDSRSFHTWNPVINSLHL